MTTGSEYRMNYMPYNETPMKGKTMNESFKKWRDEFHEIQISIDELDETFYDEHLCDSEEDFKKAEAEYQIERKKLVEKLEAHGADVPNN